MNPKPLIIAHRGATKQATENSMKAFEEAYQIGADGIELDIHLTQDGHLVVTHDENVKKYTGENIDVCRVSLAKIKSLNLKGGEKIPTLNEVLDAFAKKFSVINIEVKLSTPFTNGVEKKLVELLRQFNLSENIYISSFNIFCLLRIKKQAPYLKTGYLIGKDNWFIQWNPCIRLCQVHTINVQNKWCRQERLKKYQQLGKDIWVWTVNDPQEMRLWIERGVSAIITDDADKLKHVIANGVKQPPE